MPAPHLQNTKPDNVLTKIRAAIIGNQLLSGFLRSSRRICNAQEASRSEQPDSGSSIAISDCYYEMSRAFGDIPEDRSLGAAQRQPPRDGARQSCHDGSEALYIRQQYSIQLMASDVIALIDHLDVARAAGFSDDGVVGLMELQLRSVNPGGMDDYDRRRTPAKMLEAPRTSMMLSSAHFVPSPSNPFSGGRCVRGAPHSMSRSHMRSAVRCTRAA